jgi:hypothetical protein
MKSSEVLGLRLTSAGGIGCPQRVLRSERLLPEAVVGPDQSTPDQQAHVRAGTGPENRERAAAPVPRRKLGGRALRSAAVCPIVQIHAGAGNCRRIGVVEPRPAPLHRIGELVRSATADEPDGDSFKRWSGCHRLIRTAVEIDPDLAGLVGVKGPGKPGRGIIVPGNRHPD